MCNNNCLPPSAAEAPPHVPRLVTCLLANKTLLLSCRALAAGLGRPRSATAQRHPRSAIRTAARAGSSSSSSGTACCGRDRPGRRPLHAVIWRWRRQRRRRRFRRHLPRGAPGGRQPGCQARPAHGAAGAGAEAAGPGKRVGQGRRCVPFACCALSDSRAGPLRPPGLGLRPPMQSAPCARVGPCWRRHAPFG